MSGLRSHNEFDSLETFFNTRLKDASLEPTDNSWMLIEEELNRLAKEKRRRRFLWFFSSGVVLTCGLVSLFYLLNGNQWALTGSSTQSAVRSEQPVAGSSKELVENKSKKPEVSSEQQEAVAVGSEQPVKEVYKSENKVVKNEKEVAEIKNKKTESSSIQRIQLGAFKHAANVNAFNKIPYKVIAVNSSDGYTKYYAESNDKNALEKVQQAGFAGAFIKENFDESLEKSIVKNEGVTETPEPAYLASGTRARYEEKEAETRKQGPGHENANTNSLAIVSSPTKNIKSEPKPELLAAAKTEKQNETNKAAKSEESSNKAETPITINEGKELNNETKNETPVAAVTNPDPKKEEPVKNQTTALNNETTAVNTKPEITKQETAATTGTTNPKPETAQPETAVNIETKKDSTPVKEEKKDSVQTPVKTAVVDSNKTDPFKPVWSLSFLGGPNFFNTNSQSTYVKTLNEHQNMTYNGELKLQYQPMRSLSFSGGVNYSTFTAQQDATYFRFYKYQTEDYQFHSSFGSMAVPMNVMLQGFYMGVPIDTFSSKYSYTTTLQTINIPVQANVHFLNKKWVNLSLGIGANSSYAIGQHTHFSLIKENSTVDFNYNNVTANKFNLMLIASLGCDIRVTKHWYLILTPSYRYGVTNMSPGSGTTYKPAFFSANGGVKFNF